MTARPWTQDDDRILRSYADAELTVRQAARALKRSRAATLDRARELGLGFVRRAA